MNNSSIPFSVQVKQAAHGRWFEILENLEPALKDAIKHAPHHVPSPKRGGVDGFRFLDDGNECGAAFDNLDGCLHNGFDVLLWLDDRSTFSEQLGRVAQYLGMTKSNNRDIKPREIKPVYEYKPPVPSDDELLQRRLALRKVWKESFSIMDSRSLLARTYLTKRGLDLNKLNLKELSKSVRFHPKSGLWHKGKYQGSFPAIISLVQNAQGEAVTIHKTYLDHQGNKLNISVDGISVNNKKFMKACCAEKISGSAVRLGKPKKTLHIAEGLETSLSVAQAIKEDVWMCGNSTLLALLDLSADHGIERIIDWADKDRPKNGKSAGTNAALELSSRMKERGIEVITLFPDDPIPDGEKSVDWNDVLVRHGEAPFLNSLNNYQQQYL